MGIDLLGFLRKRRPPASSGSQTAGHRGYFAIHDAYGDDFDDNDGPDDPVRPDPYTARRHRDNNRWDRDLSAIDAAIERDDRHKDLRWWHPTYWRGRRKLWWISRSIALFLAVMILIIGWLAVTAPLSKSLEPIAAPQLTLLAADGTPIARNGAIVDAPVTVEDLPDDLVHAFLAIEDRRFYSHWGVDPRGLARALWTGYGGGSTITQQLAKFTFLTPERSLSRKAREMLIAFWLEAWLSKDEILERYLSNAYFGDNVYGLRAASLHYFYRQPENLKREQAIMLAGLVQAPSRYAPTRHFERAKKRMDIVADSMVAAGYLTAEERAAIPVPKIDSRTNYDVPTGTYFADWALPIARQITQSDYNKQTLTTTLDSDLQAKARRAVSRYPLGNAQVALVAMRKNGEVVAMIGGKDYQKSPFNRATQARRQPGSTFKLFVYLAALEEGWRSDDKIENRPMAVGGYSPKNANDHYSDTLTLKQAFAQSSNVAAVRLFQQVGDDAVIDVARDLGIRSPIPSGDPSVALGTSTLTLLELTAAYAGVASNRFPVRPRAFAEPEESWVDWLTKRKGRLDTDDHDAIEQMLRSAINNGTGRAAMLRGPNFGKTGTSQNHRDALFIGYAGDLVVGVWIGNDDNSPLTDSRGRSISGGGLPARIWRDFMNSALAAEGGGQKKPDTNGARPSDPDGPIEPLDAPDIITVPIDNGRSELRVGEDNVSVSTQIEGVPLDITLDENGVSLQSRDDESNEDQ